MENENRRKEGKGTREKRGFSTMLKALRYLIAAITKGFNRYKGVEEIVHCILE